MTTDAEKMTEGDFLMLFALVWADLKDDHFVLASGHHSDRYFNKKLVFENQHAFNIVATAIAHRVMQDRPEVLVAPQNHGAMLAEAVRLVVLLTHHVHIPIAPAEKGPNETFFIKPEHEHLVRGKRTVFVEDILTTGGSVKKAITCAKAWDCVPVSLHAFVDRGGITADALGVPALTVLARVNANKWTEEECPLCKTHAPVNETVGHGHEYMDRKRAAG